MQTLKKESQTTGSMHKSHHMESATECTSNVLV